MASAVPSGAPITKAKKLAVRLTPSDRPTIWRSSASQRPIRLAASPSASVKSLIAPEAHRSERLALEQPRHFAGEPRGLADEQVFQRRGAVDQAEADVAHGAQQRRLVGEQEVERVGGDAHRHG